jgi:hypothetical protein
MMLRVSQGVAVSDSPGAALASQGVAVLPPRSSARGDRDGGSQYGGSQYGAPPTFPERVHDAAVHLLHAHVLPVLTITSPYERRALHRAALLYLSARQGRAAFPPALLAQWAQLFSTRWALSENERGLKDVLRALGFQAKDPVARQWLLSVVE